MPEFLGIDTSNYTTSAAIFNSETNKIVQEKKLLPVKSGECGLRQSDAVFHHVNQLSDVLSDMLCGIDNLTECRRVPEMPTAHICPAFCREKQPEN